MKKKINIVTISRQYGSGGRMIGAKLAEELSIPFYDRMLIDKIADESGYDSEFVRHSSENINLSQAIGQNPLCYGAPFQDMTSMVGVKVFASQEKVIRKIAEEGPCVIVGRCADFILRDRDDVFDVYIHSDMDARIKRVVENYGLDTDNPERDINKVDKARAKHYSFYTDNVWGEAENYDLSLNSDSIGLEKVVAVLLDIVKDLGGKSATRD